MNRREVLQSIGAAVFGHVGGKATVKEVADIPKGIIVELDEHVTAEVMSGLAHQVREIIRMAEWRDVPIFILQPGMKLDFIK